MTIESFEGVILTLIWFDWIFWKEKFEGIGEMRRGLIMFDDRKFRGCIRFDVRYVEVLYEDLIELLFFRRNFLSLKFVERNLIRFNLCEQFRT